MPFARRRQEGGDAVRQGDVVIVEVDDPFAASGGEAEVPGSRDAELGAADDPQSGGRGGGNERPAVVDDNDLDIPKLLSFHRRQGLPNGRRTGVGGDDGSDFGAHLGGLRVHP